MSRQLSHLCPKHSSRRTTASNCVYCRYERQLAIDDRRIDDLEARIDRLETALDALEPVETGDPLEGEA